MGASASKAGAPIAMRASAGPISFLYILWMSRPEPGTVRAVLPRRLNVLHSAVIRSVAGLVLSEGLTVGQDRHWTEAQIPPPPSNTSLRACTWVTLAPAARFASARHCRR